MAFHVLFMKTPTIEAQGTKEKKFTSIQVKKGDSLWSIAKEHMGDEYDTVDDYIDDQNNSNKQFVIITNVAFTFFIYDVEKFIHK